MRLDVGRLRPVTRDEFDVAYPRLTPRPESPPLTREERALAALGYLTLYDPRTQKVLFVSLRLDDLLLLFDTGHCPTCERAWSMPDEKEKR